MTEFQKALDTVALTPTGYTDTPSKAKREEEKQRRTENQFLTYLIT